MGEDAICELCKLRGHLDCAKVAGDRCALVISTRRMIKMRASSTVDEKNPHFLYRIPISDMYNQYRNVCHRNIARGAKICKDCPFVGFIMCATQTYADLNDLKDPTQSNCDEPIEQSGV